MASPSKTVQIQVDDGGRDSPLGRNDEDQEQITLSQRTLSQQALNLRSQTKTPESQISQQQAQVPVPESPGSPCTPSPFDWEDFEERYEKALVEADEEEKAILVEAENLSKYFRTWASAASAHDDERAVKRLQTRKRFVNMREESMVQKQQHYEDVVRAFENALALLRS